MEILEIPELTSEQTDSLCLIVEDAAREYIVSKVPFKKIEKLDISVETEGAKPVTLKVDVAIELVPSLKNVDPQKLADEAVKKAFISAEKYLREVACHSKK
jgi:hypothetical protein